MTTATRTAIEEAVATMTRMEMATAITIHEAERKGIEMSSQDIKRKARCWVRVFDRADFGGMYGLADAYVREMSL